VDRVDRVDRVDATFCEFLCLGITVCPYVFIDIYVRLHVKTVFNMGFCYVL
jgi:hypothetical protein